MSAQPDFKQCLVDKTQSSLVEFAAAVKKASEAPGSAFDARAASDAVEWAKNLLRASQDVVVPDVDRKLLVDDLREFAKDVRKLLTKHAGEAVAVPPALIELADSLLARAGYSEPVANAVPKRRSPA